jgi:DNA-binding NtrC family response regulator
MSSPPKVLIIDDTEEVLTALCKYFRQKKYKVLSASNGLDALAISEAYEGHIHLLLTDVIMPKMNGQELADAVKMSRPELQVIFMSGYTDDVIAHHGVLDEGVNFIQKPITLSRLSKRLREVLKKP